MKNTQSACIRSVLAQLLSSKNMTTNALANLLHLPTPTIHRLLTGDVQDPRISTLLVIAEYFDVDVDELIGRKPLNKNYIAHDMIARPAFSIPLLTLQEALHYKNHIKKTTVWFRWRSDIKNIFAASIKNALYEPVFLLGEIIIVDPIVKPETGDFVLIQFLNDPVSVIRKYISEGKNKYLYHVNDEKKYMKLNAKESKIIGVIIESYCSYKN